MFLCHFPGGALSGMIASCTDARLRTGNLGPAISDPAEHWLQTTGVLANAKAAECREAPVFDEHDQWLASRPRRFSEIAPWHHARRAWRRHAYYD
jgi:hypothetical protein